MAHHQFEVLLILNGEKEPYYSKIKKYFTENHDITGNFHLLYSEFGNVSNARNIGIDNAKGEYITFIDDDDYVSESYLEELLTISTKTTIGFAHPCAFDDTGVREYSVENTWLIISKKKQSGFL